MFHLRERHSDGGAIAAVTFEGRNFHRAVV